MKVVKLFKQRVESSSKYHSEIMQWMSPSLREYWGEFLGKTHSSNFLSWVRDYHKPAVNEPHVEDETKKIVLTQDAQILFDDLQRQIGEVIHVGNWILVDQERINQFGLVTEDNQWIHTDPVKAELESPFKTTIAHGFLTLALLPALTDSVDPTKPMFPTAKMMVNIGLNQVRFPYPVKVGSNIRAKSTLLKVTPIKKGLEIEREIRVEIEGVRRPACVAVSVIHLHF
ncbi:MaoC family dehydratase [Vibrio sp. ZSDZ34]|jgi:acyl dehydratase|uniref:MaoC family dehydratase n=1 Tax=Vibrio gelatinilyticus TaxID=2893468 RepID=A0A9X1WAP3_9VIBR|nr:MaoC family dehydratase [Vibrio gelatinilyticus]MCJ2377103.1 MaoC family dehydratase [Vibrio gelatinilyticus]